MTDSGNTPNDGAAERCYFVKETHAPAGFVTPTGANAFTPVSVTVGEAATADIVIENTKQGVPELPRTGGVGQTALISGDLGLVAAGVGAMAIRRRKASV